MGEWTQIRWTEARQVASLMDVDDDALPDNGLVPEDHYRTVRDDGRRDEAVGFLGHALPRFEAIAWAARILEDEAATTRLKGTDQQALDYALRWLGDPDDDRRRAAMEAAEQAGARSPERMLATAVFSGGSISQPDLPPVLPSPEIAGRLAASAIVLAAHRSPDAASVLDRALDLGEKVAQQGTRALKPA